MNTNELLRVTTRDLYIDVTACKVRLIYIYLNCPTLQSGFKQAESAGDLLLSGCAGECEIV